MCRSNNTDCVRLPCEVFERESDGVLGHHRLAGRGVCSHEHALMLFQKQNGLLLEWIWLKWPLEMESRSLHAS